MSESPSLTTAEATTGSGSEVLAAPPLVDSGLTDTALPQIVINSMPRVSAE